MTVVHPETALLEEQRLAKTRAVLAEVAAERVRQRARWGDQQLPGGTGTWPDRSWANVCREACEEAAAAGRCTFRHVLLEEVAEACAETDPAKLRAELVQVAAVAVQWIDAIDRLHGPAYSPRCVRCGCPAVDHAVDDEERRECTACECAQYEAPR